METGNGDRWSKHHVIFRPKCDVPNVFTGADISDFRFALQTLGGFAVVSLLILSLEICHSRQVKHHGFIL
jgi:hypothetical protein